MEKENRIKELEARETHFTQEIDRLQCNMDELKVTVNTLMNN